MLCVARVRQALYRTRAKLHAELGRAPHVGELADALELPPADLSKLLDAASAADHVDSLDRNHAPMGGAIRVMAEDVRRQEKAAAGAAPVSRLSGAGAAGAAGGGKYKSAARAKSHTPFRAKTSAAWSYLDTLSCPAAAAKSDEASRDELNAALKRAIERTCSPKEQQVLALRFGLDGRSPRSAREVAASVATTTGYVRNLECRAIRKLRHPSALRSLRAYREGGCDDDDDDALDDPPAETKKRGRPKGSKTKPTADGAPAASR